MMKRTFQSALIAAACACAGPALANPEGPSLPPAPEMTLEAQARSSVDNDLMTVVMSVESEGPLVQAQTQKALAAMQLATVRAKEKGDIDVRVGSVTTYPVYGPKGKTANWQVRGDVTLTSTNAAALGLLASQLTADMQISSVNFSLSRPRRDAEESKLTAELAATFKRKAQAATTALGFKSYSIKKIAITQDISMPQGPRPMMAMMRVSADTSSVPVPTEGGKTEVVLGMSGAVELR